MTEQTPAHYRRPGWFTQHVFNPFVAILTRCGVSIWGSRVLEVRGRTTGEPRRTPVNLLTLDGRRYLVSPRGEGQWVRNVRAAGGRLATIVGRRREEWIAHELADSDKVPVLRAYLRRWKAEVGVFFDGTSADSTDDELAAIAPRHPVFVLEPAADAEATDAEAAVAEATDDVTGTAPAAGAEADHSDTGAD
ncbi:MAG TPA: nitroreductase/quinone reductase family protein, partial [Acidimicrobiales bacterium]